MYSKILMRLLGAIGLLLIVAPPVAAQQLGRVEQTESNAQDYFYHVTPGTRTILVQVVGTVHSPGLYEVSEGTGVRDILALAGGPVMNPRLKRTKRNVTLVMYRPAVGDENPLFQESLTESGLYSTAYPELEDGDVIRVDVLDRRLIDWRDVLQILTASATILFWISRAQN